MTRSRSRPEMGSRSMPSRCASATAAGSRSIASNAVGSDEFDGTPADLRLWQVHRKRKVGKVLVLGKGELGQEADLALRNPVGGSLPDRRDGPSAISLDLSLFEGHRDFIAAGISGHDLEFRSHERVE